MKPDPKVGQQTICYHLHIVGDNGRDYLAWKRDETRPNDHRWYCTPDSPAKPADAPYPPLRWREFVGVGYVMTEYNPSIKITVRR